MPLKLLLLTVLNSLLMVSGQLLWKAGMQHRGVSGFADILQACMSPLIIAGFLVYVVATFLWLYILSKAELSFAYPLQSLAYVIALVMAVLLFKEAVSINRWIGVLAICLGVYLVAMK